VTPPPGDPRKILVVQPSWVGDAVMATPTLRALRQLYPNAHISYLVRRYVKPIYTGMPWADQLISYRTSSTHRPGTNLFRLSLRLRRAKFDLAILLPNSFKTALICKGAGIPRIVGYERDARTMMLTDRLIPLKHDGKFTPTPIVRSYLALAHHLGSSSTDLTLQLFVTDTERRQAEETLAAAKLPPSVHRPGSHGAPPLVLLNPGAQYGEAKCWPPERFAAVADELVRRHNATILVSGAPRERQILDEVLRKIRTRAIDLSRLIPSPTLGSLKEIIRRCDLMITNDTGPRHIAAAMNVPVITIFGPTHQAWTEIYFEAERKIAIPVDCGPCQKKICPLDHRCMTGITPENVTAQAEELLKVGLTIQGRSI
jgi:heptosyltransferase-2